VTLARGVEDLLGLPNGSRLFRYEREGELAVLTAPALNEYLGENMGDSFTAKDFRTWGGTLLAATELEKHQPPTSGAQAKRILAGVMRTVAEELGNTAAVARDSYVSPVVVDSFLAGRTLGDFRTKSSRPSRLTRDERALVRLLRSRS
jgi:DNA topoisomerase-1